MSSGQNQYLDTFYKACENTGAFLGYVSANVLNYTADYIAIGAEGIKKGGKQYKKYVKPAFEETKNKVNQKLDSIDTKSQQSTTEELTSE
jgi:hypothetical protein